MQQVGSRSPGEVSVGNDDANQSPITTTAASASPVPHQWYQITLPRVDELAGHESLLMKARVASNLLVTFVALWCVAVIYIGATQRHQAAITALVLALPVLATIGICIRMARVTLAATLLTALVYGTFALLEVGRGLPVPVHVGAFGLLVVTVVIAGATVSPRAAWLAFSINLLAGFIATATWPLAEQRAVMPSGQLFQSVAVLVLAQVVTLSIVVRWPHASAPSTSAALLLQHADQPLDARQPSASTGSEEPDQAADVLASLSHAIRTSLNGIIGMSELLLDSDLETDERDTVRTIHTSAQTLLDTVFDILDLSRIESGTLDLDETEFEPGTVVENVVDALLPLATERRVELLAYVAPDVPGWVRGDPARLRQLLVSMAGHAIRHVVGSELIISAQVAQSDGSAGTSPACWLHFAVADPDPQSIAGGQDAFSDAGSLPGADDSRGFEGSRLSLRTARKLARQMGGDMSHDDTAGRAGTRWLTLPFNTVPVAHISTGATSPARGRRALLLVSSVAMRNILFTYLSAIGMRVESVGDIAGASSQLRLAMSLHDPFEIVLVDLGMSGSDDLPVVNMLRNETDVRTTHFILLTNGREGLETEQALEHGFVDSITKPVKRAAVQETIVRVLTFLGTTRGTRGSASSSRQFESARASQRRLSGRQRYRILVAEDNAVNQKLAKLQLQKLGYSLDIVSNGQEALEALAEQHYALALMDCAMPVMDGYEATQVVRAGERMNGEHLPIIGMTTGTMPGEKDRCLDAGMDDSISKPVNLETLEQMLLSRLPDSTIVPAAHDRSSAPLPHSSAPLAPAWNGLATVPEDPDRSSSTSRAETRSGSLARVLLVDDNRVNQQLTTLQLQKLGCDVDVAADGQQALDALGKQKYSLVLMDCSMPVMDGYDATRAIRAAEAGTDQHMTIIAVTANALREDREKCLAAGMDDYIAKPIKLIALHNVLANWLKMPESEETITPTLEGRRPRTASVPLSLREMLAAVPALEVLDATQIATIRALQSPDSPDVVAIVIGEFRRESPDLIRTMRESLAHGDYGELTRAAHSLKSSSAYVGAQILSRNSAELERTASSGQGDCIAPEQIDALDAELQRVLAALEQITPASV